jgi:tetratricopeptide (TPR) repeat protein
MQEHRDAYYDEEDIIRSINRYEDMLKQNAVSFFDIYEFEYIVEYYLDTHNFERAFDAVMTGLNQHPASLNLKFKLAQILILSGKPSKGLILLREIEQLEKGNSDFYLLMGTALNVMGRSKDAKNAFDKAIQMAYVGRDEVVYSIAFSYISTRQYAQAIKYLQLALEINPENISALHELALCYERTDDLSQGIKYYQKYLDLDPFAEHIWFSIGMLYSSLERYDKAIEAFDYAIAIMPDYTSAYFSKANAYIQAGKFYEAIAQYEEIIALEFDNLQAFCYMGECYEKLGMFRRALYFYRKAREIDNNYPDAWYGMGMANFELGECETALKYIKGAIRLDPENPDYWYTMGEIYRKVGKTDKSVEAFNRTVELDPNDYEAWLSHADIFFRENKLKDAINVLRKAYQYNNDISTVNYQLAVYYLYNHQPDMAYKYFEQGLLINYKEHDELFRSIPETLKNVKIDQLIHKYRNH